MKPNKEPHIGRLNEGQLHRQLKDYLWEPRDQEEQKRGSQVIDLVRPLESGRELWIEIQTGGFSPLKSKLRSIPPDQALTLVHPIPREKYICKFSPLTGERLSRRKSPKKGRPWHVFSALTSVYWAFDHPQFSLQVLMTQQEELRSYEEGRAWRRKGWVIQGRSLAEVHQQWVFDSPLDFLCLFPGELPENFTNGDLAALWMGDKKSAAAATYCLRHWGLVEIVGKRSRFVLYKKSDPRIWQRLADPALKNKI